MKRLNQQLKLKKAKKNRDYRRLGKIVLPLIISAVISLPLTFYLSDIDNNAIDRTFNTTNMLAFIGFTLALYFFVNDTIIKLKRRVKTLERGKEDIDISLSRIDDCHQEISDDLLALFFMMIIIFAIEILGDVCICQDFGITIWYGVLTINSIMFFLRCLVTILSLFVIYDVFVTTMKLSSAATDDKMYNE